MINKEMKIDMQEFPIAYLRLVKETTTITDSITEFIDDGIDAGATLINLNYDFESHNLKYEDNGCGMSYEKLVKYATKVFTHMETDSNVKSRIGIKGVGSKNALLKLANTSDINHPSYVTWQTSTGDDVISNLAWKLCEYDDCIKNTIVYSNENHSKFRGTMITIENCIDITNSRLNCIANQISKTYGEFLSNGIDIRINGASLKGFDPMYLNILGDKINYEGLHLINGFCYIVRKKKMRNSKGEMVDVRYVGLFMPRKGKSKNDKSPFDIYKHISDDGGQRFSGIYSTYNRRYIENGDNTIRMIEKNSNGGGVGRTRMLILIDEKNQDIFGVKSNKSNGIINLKENDKLFDTSIEETSFFQSFICDYIYLTRIYRDFESPIKPIPITHDALSLLYDENLKTENNVRLNKKDIQYIVYDDNELKIDKTKKVINKKTIIKEIVISAKAECNEEMRNKERIKVNISNTVNVNNGLPFICEKINDREVDIHLNGKNNDIKEYLKNGRKEITEITKLWAVMWMSLNEQIEDEKIIKSIMFNMSMKFF